MADLVSRIKHKLSLKRRHSSGAASSSASKSTRSAASSLLTRSSSYIKQHRETSSVTAHSQADVEQGEKHDEQEGDVQRLSQEHEDADEVTGQLVGDSAASVDPPIAIVAPPSKPPPPPPLQPSSPRPQVDNKRLSSIDEVTSPISPVPVIPPPLLERKETTDEDSFDDSSHHDPTDSKKPDPSEPTSNALLQPSVHTPALGLPSRPLSPLRRQSLLSNRQLSFVKAFLDAPPSTADDTLTLDRDLDFHPQMVTRKIWVKRPHASATLVSVNEDDLVDDVRDMILRKYANSLGRTFDSPDLTIRICPREGSQRDRMLGPEEPICRTLDAYFPGGQNVEEALIIDIPRRTPKASPRPTALHVADDPRPSEAGEGYFPPVGGVYSPHHQMAVPAPTNGAVPHSISVLGTGHIPPIPSPGGTRARAYRERPDRPRLGRGHTSSPTVLANNAVGTVNAAAAEHGMQHYVRAPRSRTHSNSSEQNGGPPPHPHSSQAPVSPIPKIETRAPTNRVSTPPPRVSSPRPSSNRIKKTKKINDLQPNPASGLLNGGIPPIRVLIVEDNPINLKLLETFTKRKKVRWDSAMNGKIAVDKWRTGGFHLVLMDIQLPIMNGLDATKEIRRLERVNSIGVFSSSPDDSLAEETESTELSEEDRLKDMSLFKSPVIIVALTASALQSDRRDALAAGCNDFLTKPVNFDWLERKIMEWGCMQALIDFDGWQKWKDLAREAEGNEANKKTLAGKNRMKKPRSSLTAAS